MDNQFSKPVPKIFGLAYLSCPSTAQVGRSGGSPSWTEPPGGAVSMLRIHSIKSSVCRKRQVNVLRYYPSSEKWQLPKPWNAPRCMLTKPSSQKGLAIPHTRQVRMRRRFVGIQSFEANLRLSRANDEASTIGTRASNYSPVVFVGLQTCYLA